jgi:hypothetical protein
MSELCGSKSSRDSTQIENGGDRLQLRIYALTLEEQRRGDPEVEARETDGAQSLP